MFKNRFIDSWSRPYLVSGISGGRYMYRLKFIRGKHEHMNTKTMTTKQNKLDLDMQGNDVNIDSVTFSTHVLE